VPLLTGYNPKRVPETAVLEAWRRTQSLIVVDDKFGWWGRQQTKRGSMARNIEIYI